MKPVRLAIIGCGAVTRKGYLPACSALSQAAVTWLADTDLAAAGEVADAFNVPNYTQDYCQALDEVDAVIIATPPALHAQMTEQCLNRGLHVLCEKPLTRTAEEARRVIELGRKTQLHFAVSTNRRFCHNAQLLKTLLDMNLAGDVQSFELEEGHEFHWPMQSGYRFARQLTGGGVLAEFGPHVLDCLRWWLGGDVSIVDYEDDNLGGVESDAKIELVIAGSDREIRGSVTISNTRNLRNTIILHGERGTIEAALFGDRDVTFRSTTSQYTDFDIHPPSGSDGSNAWADQMAAQLSAFVESILDGQVRYTPASDALQVSKAIEDCYRMRKVMLPAWEAANLPMGDLEPERCTAEAHES